MIRFRKPCAWIILVATCTVAAVWLLTFDHLRREERQAIEAAQIVNANLTAALEEQATRTFGYVEQLFALVLRDYRRSGTDLDLPQLLREVRIDPAIYSTVAIVDAQGRVVVHGFAAGEKPNVEELSTFATHRESVSSEILVGRPVYGPVSGAWIIPVSQRIDNADGTFGGAIFAGVQIKDFTDFFRRSELDTAGAMMLVGRDGIVRARHVPREGPSSGHDMRGGSLARELEERPVGTYLTSAIDRIEDTPRYFSYRALPKYGLVVLVGSARDDLVSAVEARKSANYLVASLATLFAVIAATALIALLQRQRRMIDVLARNEGRFRAAFDQAAVGICEVSADARLLRVNRRFAQMFGFSEDEMAGKSWATLLDDDSRLTAVHLFEDVRNDEGGRFSPVVEKRCLRRDGGFVWVLMTLAWVEGDRSPDGYYIAVLQDISKQKQAQEELRFKNTVLATQQDTSVDGILLVDQDGRVASYNRPFVDLWRIPSNLLQLSEDGPLLRYVMSQVKDSEQFIERVRYLYDHKQDKSHEFIELNDGRTLERYSAPVLTPEGVYLGRVWYFRDVTGRRLAEQQLRESEQRFRRLAETIEDVFWMRSADSSSIAYVSPSFDKVWARSAQAVYANPATWLDTIHREDLPHVKEALETLAAGTAYNVEYRIIKPDGSIAWIHDRGYPQHDSTGNVVLTTGVATDITERKSADESLRLHAKVFENVADGVVITDARGYIESVNTAFTKLTGYSPEEVRGRTPAMLKSERQDADFYAEMWRTLLRTGRWQGELWNRRKDGALYAELLSITALRDADGKVSRYVGVFNDISTLKQYQEKLRYLADHDVLTGLPNRALFAEKTAEALASAKRHGDRFAILFVDLDHFKNVNDSLGHAAGDLLLRQVAQRAQEALRETDMVARFGGDEFAVLLQRLPDDGCAEGVAQKLLSALAPPFQIHEHELFVTASIGVASYPANGQDVEELLRNADAAMYRAKSAGRNNSSVFASGLNERAYEVLMLTNALRHAITRGELTLHYQLRYDLASGCISGAEALARWHHPTMGAISPTKFIPLAEEAGLIGEIGMWVLRTACHQMKAWQAAGLGIARIAVNLSARQFHEPRLVNNVASVLHECGLDALSLELEVTESVMMNDPDAAAKTLQQLHAMGVSISIDDFGTGYSSLGYLKRFPISYVKIDRSFIAGLPGAADDVGIVRAIVALAKTLKLGIIGEGVETQEQRDFLRDCGCNEAQGYLFSKPVAAEELEETVQREAHTRCPVFQLPKRGAA